MCFTIILLNSAPAAEKVQQFLFPVIPVLLALLILIVVSVVAYLWLKGKPFDLK